MTTTTKAERAGDTADMEPPPLPGPRAAGTAAPAPARSCSPQAASPWQPVC